MNRVIDFRARPNTPEWARYLARRTKAIAAGSGISFSSFQAPEETLQGFVDQLDSAGISRAVFAARNRAQTEQEWSLTNEFVAECVGKHPDRIVGFGGIDASNPERAATEVRRAVRELGLWGVCFDPFALPGAPDHEAFDPIYRACDELGVPVVVTLGGWPGIPSPLRLSNPLAIDAVARRFPSLLIVASHAGWPFTQDMIAVAWRCENVYFENSFYHFAPGAGMLVDAANTMISDKMLYASAYPFVPLGETLARFRTLAFTPDVMDKVLYRNAETLLDRIAARR